jgi:valyl-tRNA synthetase
MISLAKGFCVPPKSISTMLRRPKRGFPHSGLNRRYFASVMDKQKTSSGNSDDSTFARRPNFDAEVDSKYFEYERLERDIYNWWESEGYFEPSDDATKESYVLPMPPPNVTGYLHMGHAMFIALQDILARFHRMRGKATLWLPGTDHAGIATQMLVERSLKEQGISRVEIGRDAFLDKVWEWKEEKGDYIVDQMKRLGASADWSRQKFTLETQMSDSVTEAFVQLYEKGLIYKGDYMVNWSPKLGTAVSDLEVDYTEEEGKLYYFKYELSDGSGHIPVATTRPETILGDTAVCVHPEDPRYKEFVGKMVRVPMQNRDIPVIADDYVEREFGTGALKITPAHDPNDYEIGKRHNLDLINIMNKDASINENGGAGYVGLDRFDCREKLWSDMENAGLVLKVVPHTQRVPRSERSGEVIEPMVSTQWFVKMENMGRRALNAVQEGHIQIVPNRFEKTWANWLENIHDWCISRQLWWGHRIPVYYVIGKESSDFIVARSETEAYTIARGKYGDVQLVQDEDVLDTWFSSGLWPFATVGWPNIQTTEYQRFYPASCLETGYDILFFWVARMVMMGLEFTDKSPFHTIYMHGLVRDGNGQKMSKTKGNVIDPLNTIEQYGCDALRYSLVTGSSPGQDIPLSMQKIEGNRNFVNKLWNAGKYLHNVLKDVDETELDVLAKVTSMDSATLASLSLTERYIVSRCHGLIEDVTSSLEAYEFGASGRKIYEFLWDEYADWYIEASKARMRDPESAKNVRKVLYYVWSRCIVLLHPFMPFLTEVLWQLIPHNGQSIMLSDWPKMGDESLPRDMAAEASFVSIQTMIKSIRNARSDYNVEAGKKIAAHIYASHTLKTDLQTERASIALLGRIDPLLLEISGSEAPRLQEKSIQLTIEEGLEVYLPLADLIDKKTEIARLNKQIVKVSKDVNVLEERLSSKGFTDKAPKEKVEKVRADLADKKEQLASIERSLTEYQNM